MSDKQQTGRQGQKIAEEYLTASHYQILEKNFRLSHLEIDIIALDKSDSSLVFCEVKTRTSALLDINLKQNQIQRLKKAMVLYTQKHGFSVDKCRLDYIEIFLRSKNSLANLRHLKDILH